MTDILVPLLRAALVVLFAGLVAALFGSEEAARVSGRARIVDGDTLVVAGRTIRLAGIDAPEREQTCGPAERPWRCGEAATDRLRQLASGRPIDCTARGADRYGRTVAVCRAGGEDAAARLVAEGLAVARDRYAAQQTRARAARRGLWSGPFEDPAAFRSRHPSAGAFRRGSGRNG